MENFAFQLYIDVKTTGCQLSIIFVHIFLLNLENEKLEWESHHTEEINK